MDSAGGGEHAVTAPATGLRDEQPAFSPDGTQIVFQHTTDDPTATSPLMAINADGSNQHAITTPRSTSTNRIGSRWTQLRLAPRAPRRGRPTPPLPA
jgi:Tol biopolymer transport system component